MTGPSKSYNTPTGQTYQGRTPAKQIFSSNRYCSADSGHTWACHFVTCFKIWIVGQFCFAFLSLFSILRCVSFLTQYTLNLQHSTLLFQSACKCGRQTKFTLFQSLWMSLKANFCCTMLNFLSIQNQFSPKCLLFTDSVTPLGSGSVHAEKTVTSHCLSMTNSVEKDLTSYCVL